VVVAGWSVVYVAPERGVDVRAGWGPADVAFFDFAADPAFTGLAFCAVAGARLALPAAEADAALDIAPSERSSTVADRREARLGIARSGSTGRTSSVP
jgi:hypothetical protein